MKSSIFMHTFFKRVMSLIFFLSLSLCTLSGINMYGKLAIAKPCFAYLLGSYDTPDYASGIAISGNTAYVADNGSGLQIIDVSTDWIVESVDVLMIR